MIQLVLDFDPKYIPLYAGMAFLVGCMIYWSVKHIAEGIKEVKDKDRIKKQRESEKSKNKTK
jgi:hypothetical protein